MDKIQRDPAKIARPPHLPRHRCASVLAVAIILIGTPAVRAERPLRPGVVPSLSAGIDVAPGGLRLPVLSGALLRPQPASGMAPGLQCRQAIRGAERAARIPDQLMAAIGRIESGRADSAGVVHPWPWTINAEGVGAYFQTKAEALAAVRALQARGVKSIDVGCMQVNMMYHPDAFASLEQAFDPAANAAYAARFLTRLFEQTGNWTKATAYYHSATPELGDGYQRKVAAVVPEEQKRLLDTPGVGGNVWSANAFSASTWSAGGIAPVPAGPGGSGPTGAGAFMLSNRVDQARMLPMAPGTIGRGLDAYRAAAIPISGLIPVRMTTRGSLQVPVRSPL